MNRTCLTVLGLVATIGSSGPAAAEPSRSRTVDFHGFVQGSWQGSATNRQNDFRVDEVQLEVGREWRNAVAFMLRVNYRHVDNFDAQNQFVPLDYNRFIEQAWVRIDLLKKSAGLTFTFGKFQIPIGYESVNIPDMYQYSRSFTVQVGVPNFGTGAMLRFKKSIFDIAAYAVNGWNTLTDDNDAKTFGGRLGFSLLEGDLNFGFSFVSGPERIANRPYVNVRSPRHVLDVDVMYTGVRNLTLAAELNYGYEDRASQVNPDRRGRWLSAMGTVHYKFLPWLAGTLRFEHADDPDASRLFMLPPQWLGTPGVQDWFGVPLTIESLTLAALFTIHDNVRAVVEFRNDWLAREEDRPVFPAATAGAFTKTRRLVAASLYYVW